jgi:hypothetical protein
MLELTDDRLPGDRRQGLAPTGGGDGLVQVHRVERVTGTVVDLEPVAALFDQVFGAPPRAVADTGSVTIADFDIGDLTLRLVAGATDRGTLQSVTLAVDLDAAPAGLAAAGIGASEGHDSLRLDPADTFGIELELVDG